MAGKNDKWSMFKNYMHNELGITKDDIREWIDEAVREEARMLVEQASKKFDMDARIEKAICEHRGWTGVQIKQEIAKAAAEKIVEKYDVVLKTS
jgi:ribosomal protein S17E